MPGQELVVQICTDLRSEKWRLGEYILNVSGNLTKLYILNQGNYASVLANDVL